MKVDFWCSSCEEGSKVNISMEEEMEVLEKPDDEISNMNATVEYPVTQMEYGEVSIPRKEDYPLLFPLPAPPPVLLLGYHATSELQMPNDCGDDDDDDDVSDCPTDIVMDDREIGVAEAEEEGGEEEARKRFKNNDGEWIPRNSGGLDEVDELPPVMLFGKELPRKRHGEMKLEDGQGSGSSRIGDIVHVGFGGGDPQAPRVKYGIRLFGVDL